MCGSSSQEYASSPEGKKAVSVVEDDGITRGDSSTAVHGMQSCE